MYEIDTTNGLPIESVSAGCSFGTVIIQNWIDVETIIDWSAIVKQ